MTPFTFNMLFNFIFATSLLALLRPVSSATLKSKRDTLVTPVYAYGTNVTGVLFYIDGIYLYISLEACC